MWRGREGKYVCFLYWGFTEMLKLPALQAYAFLNESQVDQRARSCLTAANVFRVILCHHVSHSLAGTCRTSRVCESPPETARAQLMWQPEGVL